MELDVVIVGAGFGGLYMLHLLKQAGISARIVEMGKDVGGAWYWNRYPGVRCDVESIEYQYHFSDDLLREWRWPERYSQGPVIREYLSFVADRLDLRPSILFETKVEAAAFDEERGRWTVATDSAGTLDCQFLILAVGPLTTMNMPQFPGMEQFAGNIYHTARWPETPVDFTGRNVAVIGTGSSGIQAIPVIAEQARSLTVFQRTPHYSLPTSNRTLSDEEIEAAVANHAAIHARITNLPPAPPKPFAEMTEKERRERFEASWTEGGFALLLAFPESLVNLEVNAEVSRFAQAKLREKIHDPARADILVPTDYPFGAKRPVLDTNYFETFNQPHVSLVDVRKTPIERFDESGIVAGGITHAVDDIVLATGFDALTGAILKIDITGRGGRKLGDDWAAGPRNYLGMGIAGYPNLFLIDGPCSPGALSNVVLVIEQQCEWLADMVHTMRQRGLATIEATQEAEDDWIEHVRVLAEGTLYPRANSWYLGANVPGKPRIFMLYTGGLPAYRQRCDEVAAGGYTGFRLEARPGGTDPVRASAVSA